MRRGKASGKGGGTAGFTLLELTVVLFLLGLLLALVVPSFEGPLASARLRAGAAAVRATLMRARTLAATGARERSVTFDLEKGEYRVAGEEKGSPLPEGVRFGPIRVSGEEASAAATVRFFPDGSGEEADIAIVSSAGGRMHVTVEPLTGFAEARA